MPEANGTAPYSRWEVPHSILELSHFAERPLGKWNPSLDSKLLNSEAAYLTVAQGSDIDTNLALPSKLHLHKMTRYVNSQC